MSQTEVQQKKSPSELKSVLEQMSAEKPEREKRNSGKNTISMLSGEIKKLLRKGYTIREISNALHDAGAGYSTNTLTLYISDIKKKLNKARKERQAKDKIESGGNARNESDTIDTNIDNQTVKKHESQTESQTESNGNIKISSDDI